MNGNMSRYELCALSIHPPPSSTVSRISLDSVDGERERVLCSHHVQLSARLLHAQRLRNTFL